MKTVIVTQEEPFYIPVLLGKVLEKYRQVEAVVILPGVPRGFTYLSYVKRLYDLFGPRDFILYGTMFTYHKIADFLSRWKRFRRSYSVKSAARRNSVPVFYLKNVNNREAIATLKGLEPEVILSVAAPQIFKKEFINIARHTVNIHAALLPRYRGMKPCFWVLAGGERTTGVTVHHINENIDTGNIILQKTIDITPEETFHSLQKKVADTGATALLEALAQLNNGNATGTPQGDNGSYHSFPDKQAAREFRARGRRFI